MVGRGAPTGIDRSTARRCRRRRQPESRRSIAPAAMDRFAPRQSATRPAARRHQRPDARNSGGEVSRVMLHELEHPCPPTIISKSSLNVCFWHGAAMRGDPVNAALLVVTPSGRRNVRYEFAIRGLKGPKVDIAINPAPKLTSETQNS